MMFSDIVISSEKREQLEESLESWQHAEGRGIKASRSKTVCPNEYVQDSGTVRIEGVYCRWER